MAEVYSRCNRDDQKHLELKGERVKAQRELEELRKLGGSKQKEVGVLQ